MEELIRAWDGEEVVVSYDRASGAWMFVCIHSTVLGPAGGGTRLQVYERPAEGLRDAMRLAGAMTLKMAAADVPFGGAKAVLAVTEIPRGEARRRLLLRYGELASTLGGTFQTGPDVNTSIADMDVIAERHGHVFCRSPELGGSGDPGPYTARGVFHGLRASVARVYGSPDLDGRSVLVQGVGDVGRRLAEQLAGAGARVLVADVDAARAAEAAAAVGGEVVSPGDALTVECDVYAPCALGGTLNAASIPALRCRVVAGCANNQLAEPEDADRLRAAGILYAPDFVINAGGVLHAWGTESLGWDAAAVEERLAGIGDTLNAIFDLAEAEGTSTDAAALELARARLAAAQ
ncbi:MAG TPA: Glu/Leu/Phe/Val dehydrogenase dimerization domain-containing protein [Gaiellaceae bacterium]|nr:Glu/Leu/Phe/Val dehydrogenase dimerization domain-containing protein [Gaiellaceae bacterium]